MGIASDLRQSVLLAAVQGNLTEHRKEDGTAKEFIEKISAEKRRLISAKKVKKGKVLDSAMDNVLPFDIPRNWEWAIIDDLFSVTKLAGFEYTKYFKKNILTKDNEVPIVRAQNVKMGKFKENINEAIPLKLSQLLERSALINDCLLMTFIGSVGDTCIYHSDKRHHLAPNVAKIEPYSSEINLKYFLIWLMSDAGQKNVNKIKNQTAQPSLSMSTIRSIKVAVPPLAEQRRIVARVDALMKEIDELEQTEKELEAIKAAFPSDMKASLLQAAMEGKLTEQKAEDGDARGLLLAIREEKEKLVKEKKIKKEKPLTPITDEEIPFDIPENWVWCRLGDCIKLLSGQDLTPDKYNASGKGTIYITGASNIENGRITVNRWTEFPRAIAHKGELLITCKGTIGEMCFLNIDKVHIARQIMSIKEILVDIKYVHIFLLNYVNTLKGNAKSMIPGIERKNVLNALFPLPPLSEQQRIVEKLDQLLPLCDSLSEH